jgi:hypothetical protein
MNMKQICIMIEGKHKGEPYESSHGIPREMIMEYVKEFLDSYDEEPESAKLNLFYCDCGCCNEQ